MMFRRSLLAAVALTWAAISVPAMAESRDNPPADSRRPGEIARDGAEALLRAFDRFVETIPQYALPEINERGDVIIRRKNPLPGLPHSPSTPEDEDVIAL